MEETEARALPQLPVQELSQLKSPHCCSLQHDTMLTKNLICHDHSMTAATEGSYTAAAKTSTAPCDA